MPSPSRGGRGRNAIPTWRVKAGNREVYSGSKGDCNEFVRRTGKVGGKRLRVIPPNA